MIRTKLLFRRLFKQKLNNSVIIISLAVALACINLISTFIGRELNTDKFHKDYNRIYALQSDDPFSEGGKMHHCRNGSVEYMKENMSQVEDYCRINNANVKKVIANNEAYYDKPFIIAATNNFFNFFSYKLLTNNPNSVLQAENSLVISKQLAEKYFGVTDAVGKHITLVGGKKKDDMVVTGIFEKPTGSTQLNFDMVRPQKSTDSRCYIKLVEGANPSDAENYFAENKENIPIIHAGTPGQYYLKPLNEAYFDTTRRMTIEASREKKDLVVALIIGLVIVVVALFNYLGLLNIGLLENTKSFTIQRINGSSKLSIALSFIVNNIVLFSISFVLSLFMVLWAAPFFNKLTGTNITSNFLLQGKQIISLIGYIISFLAITFLFVLYRIKNVLNTNTLKSSSNQNIKKVHLPAFNVFQLASSVVLIICSIVILKQIKFISEKPIGLDKSVIEVKLPKQYADKASVIKDELLSNPIIENISISSASPVLEHYMVLLKYDDNGKELTYTPSGFPGDEYYLPTLGIEIVKGENFSSSYPSTNTNKCIINESLAKLFPDRNLIGKGLPGMESNIVIGIAKDFHYSNLKSIVEPAYIPYRSGGNHLLVKAASTQEKNATKLISQIWEQHIPDYPINIESINDRYEWLHRENQNYIRLISSCSFISIFLSMIGLFVISWRSCSYRTKEIGVRKVNGAKIREVLAMLNADFLKWVIISFIVASPIAWYAMNKWLENFAYKTEINWWIFLLAGAISMVIAVFTVSFQSFRAANRNPVEALRYE